MRTIYFCAVLLLFIPKFISAQSAELKIEKPLCEYLSNPIAIENTHPNLSWQLTSPKKAKQQTAYSILVASSLELLKQNKGDYWTTGKVTSSNTTQITYNGKPLASKTKAYWKVMVWDEKGKPSAWSPASSWGMGLLDPLDWKGKWIGAFENPYPDSAITYPSPFFRKEFNVQKTMIRDADGKIVETLG